MDKRILDKIFNKIMKKYLKKLKGNIWKWNIESELFYIKFIEIFILKVINYWNSNHFKVFKVKWN